MSDAMGSWRNMPPKLEMMVRPYLLKKAQEDGRKYDIFHPSAWGICLRKIAYQFYNEKEKFFEKKDVNYRFEMIYDNGHHMHARWQSYLAGAGILRGWWKCTNTSCGKIYGTETPLGIFNPMLQRFPNLPEKSWRCSCGNDKVAYQELLVRSEEYNFEGHVDAVVDLTGTQYATEGQTNAFVVDFKSMKDEYFSDLSEAKHEHIIQVHIYMWLLDLKGAVVCYENKDTQITKEIFVPRDENLIGEIKRQALWLKSVLANHKIPDRPAGLTRSCFQCKFCEFSEICYDATRAR